MTPTVSPEQVAELKGLVITSTLSPAEGT